MEEDDYITTTYSPGYILSILPQVKRCQYKDGWGQLHDNYCRRMCRYWITHSWHWQWLWRKADSNWKVCTLSKWMLFSSSSILVCSSLPMTPDSNWHPNIVLLCVVFRLLFSGRRGGGNRPGEHLSHPCHNLSPTTSKSFFVGKYLRISRAVSKTRQFHEKYVCKILQLSMQSFGEWRIPITPFFRVCPGCARKCLQVFASAWKWSQVVACKIMIVTGLPHGSPTCL